MLIYVNKKTERNEREKKPGDINNPADSKKYLLCIMPVLRAASVAAWSLPRSDSLSLLYRFSNVCVPCWHSLVMVLCG